MFKFSTIDGFNDNDMIALPCDMHYIIGNYWDCLFDFSHIQCINQLHFIIYASGKVISHWSYYLYLNLFFFDVVMCYVTLLFCRLFIINLFCEVNYTPAHAYVRVGFYVRLQVQKGKRCYKEKRSSVVCLHFPVLPVRRAIKAGNSK